MINTLTAALLVTGNHGWYLGGGFGLALLIVVIVLVLRR